MTDHEVYIFGSDPERVVSVAVGKLRSLCEEMYAGGVEYEDGGVMMCGTTAEHAIVHERTCHFVDRDEDGNPAAYRDGFCDRCGEEMDDADRLCPNCGAEVVGE